MMNRSLLLCALFLTGCSTPQAVEYVVPVVDKDLRTPCEVALREYESIADVGLIITDHVEALDCSNGKIVAIDEILTDAESEV